jgi:aldose 1-epimerase
MLELRAGESSLALVPELGGAILSWTREGVALLRRAAPRALIQGDVREMACFPLVPYSNRIAHGQFRFAGVTYRLALNFGDHPHSIHGVGWQRAWRVTHAARDAAMLSLRHSPDAGWPFAFAAEQRFRLTPTALHVDLAITNQHTAPVPAGLGLHPYFPRGDAALRFNAEAVWRNGADHLPSERVAVPAAWDHTAARTIGSVALDNCFEGWDGAAVLTWPDRTLTIEASDIFRCLIVYTPPGQDFFCAEPVSHMNDAINRDAMHVLAPGETLSGTVVFRLAASA